MTIMVWNMKGGVGKTTTLINLAQAMHQQGQMPLVMDLDPQLSSFNTFKSRLGFAVKKSTPTLLRQAAELPLVLIDAPPTLSKRVERVLYLSDLVLIPVLPEHFSLQGLMQLVGRIQRVQQKHFRLKYKILLNQYSGKNETEREAHQWVMSHVGRHVLSTTIPRSSAVVAATAAQMSVLTYDPNSAVSLAYRALAAEIHPQGA